MPLDTCITNVGEYYSSHYLDSTFAKDVKELVGKWNEQGSQSPPRRLQNLSQHYFRAKTQALDESDPTRRRFTGEEVRSLHAYLLQSLGYTDLQPFDAAVEGGEAFVPTLGRVNRYNKPWLVVCETPFCLPDVSLKEGMPSEDPLEMKPQKEQLQAQAEHTLCEGEWSRCIGRIFTEEDSPRWVLLLAGSQVLLLDRNTFAQGRWLAFDIDDAYGRKEKDTFNHIAAFLAADTLCPGGESDDVLLDKLEEQSHRFAHGVTENLQFAVREAIELLVNEWSYDRTERQKRNQFRLRPEELRFDGKPMTIDLAQADDGSYGITAEHLKHEALVFVYRLLFCFYAEARGGELEILPIEEDTYRLGYSLESLRDLELVPLSAGSEDGGYFHEHLKKLFRLIHEGFHPHDKNDPQVQFQYQTELVRTFTIRPLTATLFAPDSTPLLNRARLSNRCLQQVIQKLSLSKDDRSGTIGRVNYAELGINQLGAVYEGLLSYKGMFADQDLIHVKPADKDFRDKKTPTWFVSKDRHEEFKKDEVQRLEDGKPRVFTKGTFILHLNGIDREQSASYYTPEVLTRCLVEEALRELLKDYGPEDADKILQLKICEPAMGSGAFLNEAAGQLAHRYLELKQKQLGKAIEPACYGDELRRVKHYITTRNVYGVDLNATAVELGALSLWLGSIHRLLQKKGENGTRDVYRSGATPWFGLRLRCGNSLIGARRAVWATEQLKKGEHVGDSGAVPRLLKPGEARGENEVYHFLVFDEEMVPTQSDKLMKSFWPERCAAAKKWISQHVKPKWKPEEIKEALVICRLIDQHWSTYAAQRAEALTATACTATVWPTPADCEEAITPGPTLAEQEKVCATLESTSGSFQRLKLVMDTWCALWFWPLDCVGDLPNREAFLALARLLLGAEPPDESWRPLISIRLGFEIDALLAAAGGDIPNTVLIADTIPWVSHSQSLAREQSFHHWELTFPECLGESPPAIGFDLVLGNPPWMPVRWEDSYILNELEPMFGVRGAKSASYNRDRLTLILPDHAKAFYSSHARKSSGTVSYLSCRKQYRLTAGTHANLYKQFLSRCWEVVGAKGVAGLLHPEGPYEGAHDNALRRESYRRLRGHYQFKNELRLFSDVHHETEYSINIYSEGLDAVSFSHVSNLFHPSTLNACRAARPNGCLVPGIKTDDGHWNTKPHPNRIVHVTDTELRAFAELLDDDGTSSAEARLPQIHSIELQEVIYKLATYGTRLRDLQGDYFATDMFHESNAQRDGIITRTDSPTTQPAMPESWVISGPHFFVGTPFNRSPRTNCDHNNAYDSINLTAISDSYLPRAVYRPGNSEGEDALFYQAIPVWPGPALPGFWPFNPREREAWTLILGEAPLIHRIADRDYLYIAECHCDVVAAIKCIASLDIHESSNTLSEKHPDAYAVQGVPSEAEKTNLLKPITTRYRYVNREMVSKGERGLICTIIPPGPTHINTVFAIVFKSNYKMAAFASAGCSICYDAIIKLSGKGHCHHNMASKLPLLSGKYVAPIIARGLRLNCLTSAYEDLWIELSRQVLPDDGWTSDSPLLANRVETPWSELPTAYWEHAVPLRTEYARRQALLEIDVLVALAFGFSLDQLQTLYRVQFPIMQQYERSDEYDTQGMRVPRDQGAKEVRSARESWDGISPLIVSWPIDNGLNEIAQEFRPPFTKVDREADYARAYEVFQKRYGGQT